MKYIITITSGTNEKTFESNSRNTKRHLIENGGEICTAKDKHGFILSVCKYSEEFGYYHCFF